MLRKADHQKGLSRSKSIPMILEIQVVWDIHMAANLATNTNLNGQMILASTLLPVRFVTARSMNAPSTGDKEGVMLCNAGNSWSPDKP